MRVPETASGVDLLDLDQFRSHRVADGDVRLCDEDVHRALLDDRQRF